MHDAFSDLEKDDFLQGLITGKNLQNFIKENEEKKIKYSVVSFEDKLLKINKDYGTGKFVYFMIKFMYICLEHLATINNSEKYTLIIDEPEAFLHPGLIREVGFMLRRVNNKINVICATHSVDFLQYFCTEETDIFYKTVESGKIPSIQKEDFKSIKLSHLKLSKKKETSVINIFNRRKVFLFLMSSKIIFVEGENDLKLMEYILYKDQESKFTKDVLIWSCEGKWKILDAIKCVESTSRFSSNDFFILYDQDESDSRKEKIWSHLHKYAKWNGFKIKSKEKFMQQLEKLKSDPNEQFKDEIKEYKSFSFPVNLEKYFDICLCENKKKDQKQCECKKEFNPYDFFKKENESKKEELKKFLEKSKLNDFLDQKKRKVKKGEVKE